MLALMSWAIATLAIEAPGWLQACTDLGLEFCAVPAPGATHCLLLVRHGVQDLDRTHYPFTTEAIQYGFAGLLLPTSLKR